MNKKGTFLGEFQFIESLKRRHIHSSKTILGIGDDCAILKSHSNKLLLLSTDLLQEHVHFEMSWGSPKILGKKVVSINLSDIAAMGGKPTHGLCVLAIPKKHLSLLDEIMSGIEEQCKHYQLDLIGGDTNSSQNDLSLCFTILGEGQEKGIIRREGAKEGDIIFCSGKIGDHGLGLKFLKSEKQFPQLSRFEKEELVEGFLDPIPRIELGLQLAEMGMVSSMIDISDGLIQDLRHILNESNVSAKLDSQKIPLSKAFKKTGFSWKEACSFGEDYELLFTVSKSDKEKILSLTIKDCPITSIGEIIRSKEAKPQIFDQEEHPIFFEKEGFQHF